MDDNDQYDSDTIKQLFEAAQNIGGVLSALEASGAPVMTPYSGFSVFVAAHINMYGTIAPLRYPGGLERAEEAKSSNLIYLEQLSRLWPVGRSWVRSLLVTSKPRLTKTQVANGSRSESILRNGQKYPGKCRGWNAQPKTVRACGPTGRVRRYSLSSESRYNQFGAS